MPVLKASELSELGTRIFAAAGAPEDIARRVSDSLILSSLVGMDSHGAIRIAQYLDQIEKGSIIPDARPKVIRDQGVAVLMDGQWAFGQIVAEQAMRLAIEKARLLTVGVVSFSKVLHIGRLGEWVAMAADQGLFGMALTNGALPGGAVAPYGARGRMLGTNPIALGIPAGHLPPVVVDFSTSVTAEGKVRLAKHKGERVPDGWLVDRDGRPTTDPADLYDGGALQPFGGHKGYGLSLMVEFLGGILSGANTPVSPDYVVQNGVFMLVMDVAFFRPPEEYADAAETFIETVRGAPPAAGVDSVVIPGEPERMCRREREKTGIPVDDQTWAEIREAAQKVSVAI